MSKNDLIYLEHIDKSLRKIIDYCGQLSSESFLESSIVQDAVIRQFEVIGEASKRLSLDFKAKNPELPWKDMAGMRDKLIHDYIDVDLLVVYNTANKDVPELLKKITQIKR